MIRPYAGFFSPVRSRHVADDNHDSQPRLFFDGAARNLADLVVLDYVKRIGL